MQIIVPSYVRGIAGGIPIPVRISINVATWRDDSDSGRTCLLSGNYNWGVTNVLSKKYAGRG